MFFVYILKSQKNGRFYIGQTNNIDRRIKRHNMGLVSSTMNHRPYQLAYIEKFDSRSEAMRREKYLKSLKNIRYILNQVS